MAASLLATWLSHYDPLYHGRTLAGCASGALLSAGCGWCRPAGGYVLQRWATGAARSTAVPIGATSPTASAPTQVTAWPGVALAASTVYRFGLAAYSPGGAERLATPTIEVATDVNGDLVGLVPNAPHRLAAVAMAAGQILLSWRHNSAGEQTPPASWHVYHDNGSGTVDYDTPLATLAAGQRLYRTAAYADGTAVQFAVRAVSADGDAETNTATATATATNTPPPDAPAPTVAYGEEL